MNEYKDSLAIVTAHRNSNEGTLNFNGNKFKISLNLTSFESLCSLWNRNTIGLLRLRYYKSSEIKYEIGQVLH